MKLIYDRKIESPGTLNEIDFDRILVALKNPVMEKEIEEQLCQSGFNEKQYGQNRRLSGGKWRLFYSFSNIVEIRLEK